MIKRLLARLSKSRTKSKSQYYDDKQHPIRRHHISKHAIQVVQQLVDHGHHAYVVGGSLRDILLKKHPKDFDVATDATPEQVRRIFNRSRIIGRRFQIVHVYFGRELIEVTTFRGHHDDATSSKQASQSKSGMLLRDNVYGSIEDDAIRRDFTANSLYFDPLTETLIDFTGGVHDLREGRLVTIGDPEKRFREDPVRMLRALRFEAKLHLKLDQKSHEQLLKCAPAIRDVSAARLFDEILKLFLSGQAEKTLELLIEVGLFKYLFPSTFEELKRTPELTSNLLKIALKNTDLRIQQDKPVTPAFLYASLLWPAVAASQRERIARGTPPLTALAEAATSVISDQMQFIMIPKRFSIPMREIWELQARLSLRAGNRAQKHMENPRFRAAYDFVLLREQSGENLEGLGRWWTEYQESNQEKREQMAQSVSNVSGSQRPRKRHRRSTKPKSPKPD